MSRPVALRFAEVREQVTDSTPHLVIDGVQVTQDRLNSLLEFAFSVTLGTGPPCWKLALAVAALRRA
jgi:hypothetical protein